jgi:alkylated DNA repair dioxygenase AlkB
MFKHIDIRDGGTLDFSETFYRKIDADALFAQLHAETPWQQERGRTGPFPRLTAWYADVGLTYTYSGVTHQALPWTAALSEVRRRVEEAGATTFNSLLLNLYRDGNDSIGFHTDAEPELGANPVVASISLGAVRQFVMKHIDTGEKLKYDLPHGSLLIMGGTCQNHWLHGVPKTKIAAGPRLNLTFRKIVPVAPLSLRERGGG